MKKKQMRMEIKEISADGSFEGILSPYNTVDLGNDLVEPGAYTKTLKEHGNTVPLLWQHKSDVPIGELTLEDRPDGLWCKGQLLMSIDEAQKAYALVKARIVKGLSIGYESIKDSVANGVRRLKEIRLYEGSVVTFPMNPGALITSVKARREAKADFSTEYAELQLQDAAYQMWIALRNALCSIPWSGATREEKIAASAASIQQFTDAYMSFIPDYLDWLTEEYGEMETMSARPHEVKSGRTISAATKKQLDQAREHMKSADDILCALYASEAGEDDTALESDSTSENKAAQTKTEPDTLHSAAKTLDFLRSLIPAA